MDLDLTQSNTVRQPCEYVARMVMFGMPTEEIPGSPGTQELKIARKNNLGLEFVIHFSGAPELAKQEMQRLEDFQNTMQNMTALFACHHIEHIWIKFRKLYLYYDSNVDVIVPQNQWGVAIQLLQNEGYHGHIMFKEPDKLMFSKSGSKVSIHLHPGVTWNGVPYFSAQELWQNSQLSSLYPGGRELTDQYDFLVNLAHNVFENYEISLGDALYFKRFLRSRNVDYGELEKIASKNGWRYGFRKIYAQVLTLVKNWEVAERTQSIPENLLAYPYRIPAPILGKAFCERIASNLTEKHYRAALREIYAYPAFYALNRRHALEIFSR